MSIPGLLALGTRPPPKATHPASFDLRLAPGAAASVAFDASMTRGEASSQQLLPPVSPMRRSSFGALAGTAGRPRRFFDADAPATVLSFRAFFTEDVPESASETWRARLLVLRLYMADGSFEALAPAGRNDGMPHGKFLKRQPLPGVTADTLRVGASFPLYGRTVHVYACDASTRAFYEARGDAQPADEPSPVDPFGAAQAVSGRGRASAGWYGIQSSSITRFIEAARGSQRSFNNADSKSRFLRYDAASLRFLLQWEAPDLAATGEAMAATAGLGTTKTAGGMASTASALGGAAESKQFYWLTYHLATQEAEISEAKREPQPAGGKRPEKRAAPLGATAERAAGTVGAGAGGKRQFTTLIRRSRLPKTVLPHDDRMRSCEDGAEQAAADYYSEADFRVGGTISVYGRTMLIADCDDATAAWYTANAGVDQKAGRVDVTEPAVVPVTLPVPPHIGIGSEEDTLNSWRYLVPRAPRVDPSRNKAAGASGPAVRFAARLVTRDPVDMDRVFRISVYVDDDDVAVYEPPVRNSGVISGVWHKKSRVKNPATGAYFKLADFAVGARVTIKGHTFELTAVDSSALTASIGVAER